MERMGDVYGMVVLSISDDDDAGELVFLWSSMSLSCDDAELWS
jgi:hypothetical protein